MYAALFEMKTQMGKQQYIFEGEDPLILLSEFENVQNLWCLVQMGKVHGTKEDKKPLKKLEKLLEKYRMCDFTIEDLLSLDIEVSIGSIKCVTVVEGEEEIAKLRAAYPNAQTE